MPDVTDQLRAQVRAALKSSGITQVSAASQLGLSQKHLSQMLTGRATLTLDGAERILALCGLRPRVTVGSVSDAVVGALDALTVEARRIADALTAPLPGEEDGPHSCPPGHLYYCPTAGEWESSCHGGFDTCCDRPDLHRAASEAIPPSGNAEDCPRCTDPNPDYPFLCPGHPATDTASSAPAFCGSTVWHPAHRFMRGGQVGQCPGVEAVFAIRNRHLEQLRRAWDIAVARQPYATEHGPDWDPITGDRTWDDVSGHQFTGLGTDTPVAELAADVTTRHVGASSVGEPATADDGLRERVAAAIHRYDYDHGLSGNPYPSKHHKGEADAVLAVRDAELAEWRDLAKSALKEVEQQTERADDAEVAIARVRELHRTDYGPGGYCFGCRETPCPTITALDGPQHTCPDGEPNADGDICRPLEINGDTIHIHGNRDLTDQERGYASDIVSAAKRKFAAEQPTNPKDPE